MNKDDLLMLCDQYAQCGTKGYEKCFEEIVDFIEEVVQKEAASKQAEIDRLMLEFCPEEMPKEQTDTWEKHQRVVHVDFQKEDTERFLATLSSETSPECMEFYNKLLNTKN